MSDESDRPTARKRHGGVSPDVLVRRMENSKVLRRIIEDTDVAVQDLAKALRVDPAVLETWTEGLYLAPHTSFLVIQQAYERWLELDRSGCAEWPEFCPLVIRYATSARIAGYRRG